MKSDRPPRRSNKALAAYQKRWGQRLLIFSVFYLVVVLYEMLPGAKIGAALVGVDIVFFVVFIVDYVWRVFFLAPHRWAYARTTLCLLDLVVIASFPVLFFLNSAVLGGIARVIAQGLRLVRVGAQGGRTVGQADRIWSRSALRVIIPVAGLITAYVVLYVWRAEAVHPDASMHGLGDSAWWALFTLMTATYGDLYPHTVGGRVAAFVLMGVGLILIGWLTAALASWFVEKDEKSVDERLDHKLHELSKRLAKLDDMSERLVAMEAHLEALTRAPPEAVLDNPDASHCQE